MAEEVAQFPDTHRRSQRTYDWDRWTNGNPWRLIQGLDFDIDVDEFRNRLYGVAARRSLAVKSHKADEAPRNDAERQHAVEVVSDNGGAPELSVTVLYVQFSAKPDH
jgi:hypothetical protein